MKIFQQTIQCIELSLLMNSGMLFYIEKKTVHFFRITPSCSRRALNERQTNLQRNF